MLLYVEQKLPLDRSNYIGSRKIKRVALPYLFNSTDSTPCYKYSHYCQRRKSTSTMTGGAAQGCIHPQEWDRNNDAPILGTNIKVFNEHSSSVQQTEQNDPEKKGKRDHRNHHTRVDYANKHGIRKSAISSVTSPPLVSSITACGKWSLGQSLDPYWHFAPEAGRGKQIESEQIEAEVAAYQPN